LEIVSPIGCGTGQTFRDWITILDKPEAGFSFTPDEPTIFNNTVTFIDESSAASGWLWEFGESGISLLQNPTFTFRDSGMVEVRQIVRHMSGCTDTAIVVIDISPIVLVFFPNAFTPNGDGLNDTFFPKGYFTNIDSYELSVWNRWGEKIFSTENAETGWNGNVDNEGVVCPSGVYIFKAKYITARGELVEKEGQVTLIR
jgi:gliding motility-associated-like protein